MAVLPCPPGPRNATTDAPPSSPASSKANSSARPNRSSGSDAVWRIKGGRDIVISGTARMA
jgi:hypothetical protein